MLLRLLKSVSVSTLSFSISLAVATSFVALSADPAFANNGKGNGGGSANRGNSGRNDDKSSNSNRGGSASSNRNNGNSNASSNRNGGGNSRSNNAGGAAARELASLNGVNASPNALASAAPHSVPGRLNTYKQSRLALINAVNEQNVAYASFQRLANLTDAEKASYFPNGGYDQALSDATNTYAALRDLAAARMTESERALLQVTEGRRLSDQAMADLHRMLGF